MIDICEFLDVSDVKKPSGQVIENCEDYNGALKDFVLVLEPDRISLLETWIKNNVRMMQDHCIEMLKNEPKSTFKYLMHMRNLSECTSEFVSEAGGIQQFLDKYRRKLSTPQEETSASAEDASSDDVEEAHQEHAEEPVEITKEDSKEAFSDAPTETPTVIKEHVITREDDYMDASADHSDATEVTEIKENVPTTGTIDVTPEVIVTKKVIHKTVTRVMDYDPKLIDLISEGEIAESLRKLKDLNAKLALGGLDPDLVLSNQDLEDVYRKVYTYPPDVFKAFILAYLKSVNSETERFRISAMIDDFVKFIGR
mgnify:FL=1|jgi:hypothetical protein